MQKYPSPTSMQMFSCYMLTAIHFLAEVFIPLKIFNVLCCCLMLNWFELLFSTSIYTPYTLMVKQKNIYFFTIFINLLKIINLNDSIE